MAFNRKPRTITKDTVHRIVIADITAMMSLLLTACIACTFVLSNKWQVKQEPISGLG